MGLGMEGVFLIGILALYYFADKTKLEEFHSVEMMTFLFSIALYFSMAGYSLMSRCSDMFQVIMVVLVPELIAAIPDRKKKMLSFCALVLLNGYLLYSDLNAKIRFINATEKFQISLEQYPYITVFEPERINGLYDTE